jgi:hypothetical protein
MFVLGSLSVVQGLRTAMLLLSRSNYDLSWVSQKDLLCHLPAFLLDLRVEEFLYLLIQDSTHLLLLLPLLILDKAF